MLNTIQLKIKELKKITKFNVDLIVAFTSVLGFLLGKGNLSNVRMIFFLFIGGFLVTATAHILNQIIEKDLDKQMKRTRNRPLVTGKISLFEAIIYLVAFSITGLFLLYQVSPMAAFISFVSLIMYAFLYTPLKQISRLSIYIGAIPGALPILIGYIAATGKIDKIAISLFVFQVLWQLPHFWSIAWIWNDEYIKAGYDLMPIEKGRTKTNALGTFLSTFLLYPVLYFFLQLNYISLEIFSIVIILTLLFSVVAYIFYKKRNVKQAKRLMLASVIYLPLIQLILLINQINL